MPEFIGLADSIAKLGAVGLLALEVVLLLVGVLRVGKLVDDERTRIVGERDKRETTLVAERDRREGLLTAERDAWRDRSLATDARLDRVAAAFERLAKLPAPE